MEKPGAIFKSLAISQSSSMIKVLIFPVFALLLFSCKSKEKGNETAEAQLLSLNNHYDSALVNQDTSFLKRLYADDFVYTNPEGKLLNKEQQILSVAISEMKWDSGRSSDVKVKIYDDMAVMTGAFSAKGNFRGNPVDIYERYTAIWIRKDTTWQMVAEQGNVIKE